MDEEHPKFVWESITDALNWYRLRYFKLKEEIKQLKAEHRKEIKEMQIIIGEAWGEVNKQQQELNAYKEALDSANALLSVKGIKFDAKVKVNKTKTVK